MSDQIQLGKLIDGPAERDAIHIAVVPLVAGENLNKGGKVRLSYADKSKAFCGEYKDAIGIVDPFLEEWEVKEGQKFWCYLFPNTVTGMRHQWEHPAFDEAVAKQKEIVSIHKQWILDFCDRWAFNYEELIAAATAANDPEDKWGRYIVAEGHDLHSAGELGEDYDLFWEHLEGLTGEQYDGHHRRGLVWSCTC